MKYIFFSIIILVTALPAIYSASRICTTLSFIGWIRWMVIPVYIILFLSVLASMIAGEAAGAKLENLLLTAGFSFLVATIYFSLFFLAYDLIMLVIKITGVSGLIPATAFVQAGRIFTIFTLLATFTLMILGNHRFNNPAVTSVDIDLSKSGDAREVKIIIASDLHLGNNIRSKDLRRFVKLINSQNPDIVLLPGDITDGRLKPLTDQSMGEVLSSISAKYGVFAVPGNHEFYGGEKQKILEFLKSAGITVLSDSAAIAAAGELIIAGRDDITNKARLPLAEILKGVDKNKPLILMDHQPVNLKEAEYEGIGLSVSGHTHNGQFWPGNLIVKKVFKLGYGYMKSSGSHFIVTSGLGLWGPKYRIGTISEIVSVNLKY